MVDQMTVESLKEDILDYVQGWYALPLRDDHYRNPGIPTFRTLQARYGRQGIGQDTMYLTSHINVILWRNLSKPLGHAITNLLIEGKIHWHTGVAFAFYADEGGPLPLPLADWPVTKEYTRPHWLPVYFVPGESCDDDIGCPNYTGVEDEEEEDERFETT